MKSLVIKRISFKCNVFLYFSAITANLAGFNVGVTYAWSSPAIPRLNGQIDSEYNPLPSKITPYEESWIASFLPLGAAISAFLSGYLSDRIGRKSTLLISTIPTIAGFILLTIGSNVFYFYIGRFLSGLGTGAAFTIIPIYMGEISQSNNRGALGFFLTILLSIGAIYIYASAPYMTLRMLSATCLVVPVIFLVLFGGLVPESPYYYVSKDRIDLAERSLLKLRFNDIEMVREELPLIVKNVRESFSKRISPKEIFNDKAIKRGFIISIGLMIFQQWSGINAIFFYLQSVFEESGSGISSDICVLIAGILEFLTSACISFTADKLGRRILLLSSAVGNALILIITGVYFYLKEHEVDVSNISLLPVVTINLFVVSYTLGFGPVSFTMIGELFAPRVKSLAATLNIFVCLLSVFCVTNIFPYLKESIGIGLSCNLFGLICVVGGFFIYFKVPETRGKRLEEIEDLLRQNKLVT